MRVGACRLFTPAQDPLPHANFARSITRPCDQATRRYSAMPPSLARARARARPRRAPLVMSHHAVTSRRLTPRARRLRRRRRRRRRCLLNFRIAGCVLFFLPSGEAWRGIGHVSFSCSSFPFLFYCWGHAQEQQGCTTRPSAQCANLSGKSAEESFLLHTTK